MNAELAAGVSLAQGVVALVVLVVGIALGPLLDRTAHRSLGADPGDSWVARPLTTGIIAGAGGSLAVLLVPVLALAPAWIALAWCGAAITRTDLARHRIPDVLNIAAVASGGVLLLLPGDGAAYLRAWLAALAVSGGMLALALIGASGLGMGDVKLAPALGLYLGYLGWGHVLVGIVAGFVLGALAGLALVARAAVAREPLTGALRTALPFGPFLLLGTLVGLAWG
jgi:leader peptidase (prepilin peptidase)/N-methyltransferase